MAAENQLQEKLPEFSPAKPFLKWAGGKGRLLAELVSRAPKTFSSYYEPFLGGGALFFELQPERAQLWDINEELINAFEVVRSDCNSLIESLKHHEHSEEYFYRLRDLDRNSEFSQLSTVTRASRLIYLNKTCYNGLYRVNSKGQFNVPYGDYQNPKILDENNLRLCSLALQTAELQVLSFESIVEIAEKGDFVYFDPPYAPLSETAHFTGYSKDGFSDELQLRLRDVCVKLDKRKVKFMLSNSHTKLILALYDKFNVETVYAARAINSKAEKRGKIPEIIVRNYS